MKRIMKVVKNDKKRLLEDDSKASKFYKVSPSFKKDKQFIVLPPWMDMENPIYVEMAKGISLKVPVIDSSYEPGQVPEEEELEWFSEENAWKTIREKKSHPLPSIICDSAAEVKVGRLINYTFCPKCMNMKIMREITLKEIKDVLFKKLA